MIGELWFSTDKSPKSKQRNVTASVWDEDSVANTNSREWDKYPSQKGTVPLERRDMVPVLANDDTNIDMVEVLTLTLSLWCWSW